MRIFKLLIILSILVSTSFAVYKLDINDLLEPHKAKPNEDSLAKPVEVANFATAVSDQKISKDPTVAAATTGVNTLPPSISTSTTTTIATGGNIVGGDVKQEEKEISPEAPRVYGGKKCRGGGCPYTASWLAHVNLYKRTGWWLDSTKMETASFNLFDRAKHKFQLADAGEYYVHHMSMFEHLLHKRDGFDVARNKSQILSDAAFQGECFAHIRGKNGDVKNAGGNNNKRTRGNREYLSLIPFYGGLPPEVTAENKVKSIGQGNSLVPPTQKVLQCMASVCSTLKNFGHAIVGVANEEDMNLLHEHIVKVDPHTRHHIHVVYFNMTRPSHLPFHLLAWGQQFVKKHNCETARAHLKGSAAEKVVQTGASDTNVYEICDDTEEYLANLHPNGKVDVISMLNFKAFPHTNKETVPVISLKEKLLHVKGRSLGVVEATATSNVKEKHGLHQVNHKPIRFVYYTEMDQILRFDSLQTLHAISAASNSSCFFTGRRREKDKDSDPADYMGQLTAWRECGEPGYSFTYPTDIIVRQDKS
jgi:hypothetical protein